MSLMSLFKKILTPASNDHILGYSIKELSRIFRKEPENIDNGMTKYPLTSSLSANGINAYYLPLLIDNADAEHFKNLISRNFLLVDTQIFNELTSTHYQNPEKTRSLIVSISHKEFNSTTIRLITDSSEFLKTLSQEHFSVPPPWIAFEGYEPSWWGENMQGAQGYYNENFFLPYIERLTADEKNTYYARYSAPDEWVKSLTLMLET